MKLVVLDGYTENPGDLSWEALRAFGEVTIYERTSYVDAPIIAERLQDADIAVVNKTPITKQTLDACPHLKLICVLATGYNVVDCACAKEKGIPVCNVPAYGTASVSQFAIALLLELCHHIGHHSETVHAGRWANNADWCYWDYPMVELAGKTIGIIGFGRIGQATGRIAAALGMRVLAHSPHESGSRHAAARVGCHQPALPADKGQRGADQPPDNREDERRRASGEQRQRAASERAGCGGRAEQRKACRRGARCGFRRAGSCR